MLFTVANVYMALKTGIWDGGFPTGAILAFGVIGALTRRTSTPYDARENLVTQTVAAAAGAMPATAGVLGAFPALALMDRQFPGWIIGLWGACLGVLGLLCAFPIWRRLVLRDALPFPTGVATGEVIVAMHATGATGFARARTLAATASLAMVVTWFRDTPWAWIPSVASWPFPVAGRPAAALTLGIGWSPLMFGAGALIGPHTGLSILVGSLIAWGVLAPFALGVHEATEVSFSGLIPWLTWPGVGLMVTGAMATLLLQLPMFVRGLKDLGSLGNRAGAGEDPEMPRAQILRLVWLGLVAAVVALIVAWRAFGLHPLLTLGLLAFSALLVGTAARAAGETDFVPLGQLGQLGQVALGPGTQGAPIANMMGASIAAGLPAQAVTLIYMRAAARLVQVPLSTLTVCALIGIAIGALSGAPAYWLITSAYGLGSELLPAPSARTWKAVAEVVTSGAGAIPAHAAMVTWMAIALAVALALVGRGRAARWLPSSIGMGIGFIIPAYYSVSLCAGALVLEAVRRRNSETAERLGPAAAAGAIAGESLMGILIAILLSLGMLRHG